MLIKAEQKFSRQTSTRLRLVADAVKSLSPTTAMDQLQFMNKKAAKTLYAVVKQAISNAVNNLGLSADTLKFKEIIIGEGPHFKRFQPVSRGRAHSILKRTSHIRVVLESSEAAPVKPKKEQKSVAPVVEKAVEGKQESVKSAPVQAERKQHARSQTTVKAVTIRKTGER